MNALFTVNGDGTISRISNWDELSEREREVVLRRITKRNKERMEALAAAGIPLSISDSAMSGDQRAEIRQ